MYELLKYGSFETLHDADESLELHEGRSTRIAATTLRSCIDEFLRNHDSGRSRRSGFSEIEHLVQSWAGGSTTMESLPTRQNKCRFVVFPALEDARETATRNHGVSFSAIY